MSDPIDVVKQLLQIAPADPGRPLPGPATAQELAAFERSLGYEIPAELRRWLETCNGPLVGPGGLFGIGSADDDVNLEHRAARHPEWSARRWIPVAGDGCGNDYLLVASGEFGPGHPVVFVEMISDPLTPAFVVASGLWRFLEGLLRQDIEECSPQHDRDSEAARWPFDEALVVARDPAILDVVGVPLPWNAD